MRNILTLMFLLCLVPEGFGQVPGYLGKRLYIQYSPHFFSSFFHDGREKDRDFIGQLGQVSFEHAFSPEYVISKAADMGLDISFFRLHNFVSRSVLGSYQPGNSPYVDFPVLGYRYGLFFRFFSFDSKGAIAPYGNFTKIGFGKVHYFVSDNEEIDLEKEGTSLENYRQNYISLGFGKQHIVLERIILGYGLNSLLTFGKPRNTPLYPEVYDSAKSNVKGMLIFRIFVNAGVLIF